MMPPYVPYGYYPTTGDALSAAASSLNFVNTPTMLDQWRAANAQFGVAAAAAAADGMQPAENGILNLERNTQSCSELKYAIKSMN